MDWSKVDEEWHSSFLSCKDYLDQLTNCNRNPGILPPLCSASIACTAATDKNLSFGLHKPSGVGDLKLNIISEKVQN